VKKSAASRVYLIVALVALLLIAGIYAWYLLTRTGSQPETANKPLKLLLVGDSFLLGDQFAEKLRALAKMSAFERPFDVSVADPHASLKQHLSQGNVSALLDKNVFDIVVLQPGLDEPLEKPDALLESAKSLARMARKGGGRVTMVETWTAPSAAVRQEVSSSVIRRLADRLSTEVAPCGDVFRRARKKFSNLAFCENEGKHLNGLGGWICAACIYAVATGERPVLKAGQMHSGENPSRTGSPGISDAEAAALEGIVWETVNKENANHHLGPNEVKSSADSGIIPQGMR